MMCHRDRLRPIVDYNQRLSPPRNHPVSLMDASSGSLHGNSIMIDVGGA